MLLNIHKLPKKLSSKLNKYFGQRYISHIKFIAGYNIDHIVKIQHYPIFDTGYTHMRNAISIEYAQERNGVNIERFFEGSLEYRKFLLYLKWQENQFDENIPFDIIMSCNEKDNE